MLSTHDLNNLTSDIINYAMCNIFREAEKHPLRSTFNKSAKPFWCSELKNAHAQAKHFLSV